MQNNKKILVKILLVKLLNIRGIEELNKLKYKNQIYRVVCGMWVCVYIVKEHEKKINPIKWLLLSNSRPPTTLWGKSFLSATPCTIKLKTWPIALKILIITTISRIFSLIA